MSRLLDEMSRAERRRRELADEDARLRADEEARLAQAAADAARSERDAGRRGPEPAVIGGSAVERAWHAAHERADEAEPRSEFPEQGEAYAREDEEPHARDETGPYELQPERGRRRSAPLALAALAGAVVFGAGIWALSRTPQPADAGTQQGVSAKAAPGATSGVYMVEVGSLRDSAQAAALQQKVAQAGLRGHSENVRSEGADMIRVQAGPYVTPELAEAARQRLTAAGLDAQIVVR